MLDQTIERLRRLACLELHADLHFVRVAAIAAACLCSNADLEASARMRIGRFGQRSFYLCAPYPDRKVHLHTLQGQALGATKVISGTLIMC